MTLYKIMKKMVSKFKKDWHKHLLKALWAYRTTFWTPTHATPYSLVFGAESIFFIEVQVSSLPIVVHTSFTDTDNAKILLTELEALDEHGLVAQ